MKKILIVVGAILLAGAIAAGSFYGGIAYQTNKVSQAQANFLNARGQPNGGQLPADGGGVPAGGFPRGGAPNGQNPGFIGGGGTIGLSILNINPIDTNNPSATGTAP